MDYSESTCLSKQSGSQVSFRRRSSMAVQGPIPVEFGQVFPRGVFAAGGFEPVRDFEASKAGRFVQSKDKATGLLPAALARGVDHYRARSALPGPHGAACPRQGAGRAVYRPGAGALGVRAVPATVRRPGGRARARVRGACVSGAGRAAGHGGFRAGAPGRARRADAALPIPAAANLRALPVSKREDGALFTLRLHGTHLLIAGATGAGKGSYLWCLVRAMLPAMAAGLVRVFACDPKLMELAFGRVLFERYGRHAADSGDIAALLEEAVADMQHRAARFAGRQRDHAPTAGCPFTVVIVDEIAFLTAYQADRKLKERTLAALATLTTQGRAVGYCVVAALQD